MIYKAGSDEHKQERQPPGFGVNAEFLTALSDLVISNGQTWGLKREDDGGFVLVESKPFNRGGFTEPKIIRTVEVPQALSRLLDRIVYYAKRETRQQIQKALGLAPER